MTISTDITDAQVDALKSILRVSSFVDGNDLIKQCANNAVAITKQRLISTAIVRTSDQSILDTVITAYNSVSGTKIPLATGTKV